MGKVLQSDSLIEASSQINLNSSFSLQLSNYFRLLIDRSIEIRNWRRGEKYCTILQLIKPLEVCDILRWCECLFYLSDYSAIIRITQNILIENVNGYCSNKIKIFIFRSESEFFMGKYSNSIETSNLILETIKYALSIETDSIKKLFLRQLRVRVLLVKARIFELNNMFDEYDKIYTGILLEDDPINVVSLEMVFFSHKFTLNEKIEIFKKWKNFVPKSYAWISTIVWYRIMHDYSQIINCFSRDFKEDSISFSVNSKTPLNKLLMKIPIYSKKMIFLKDKIYSMANLSKININSLTTQIFDVSMHLDCETYIIMQIISTIYDSGYILTVSNVLDEKIPSSPLTIFTMGCYYYKQSVYSKSAHLFRKVIEIEPRFYEAHLLLAHSLSLNNNSTQAIIVYSHIQDQWRGSCYGILYKGVEYLKRNNYSMAMLNIKSSLTQFPDNPMVLNEYGVLQFYQGKFRESEETFRKALDKLNIYMNQNSKLKYILEINMSCSIIWSILYCEEIACRSRIIEVISMLEGCNKMHDSANIVYLISFLLAVAYLISGEKNKANSKYLECVSLGIFHPITLKSFHIICS
ncbi:TPR repeat-containing [Cryptosporidium sp. chipmunk genotype I]|uniref:TPR repeat-containing n=1 Tax=Cryptosporidium sp. chipmunk genotype I TaxID=1280935 RepID=UPI00351A8667|nr:TPR repeat-containing [Cryptosporidium sp. chipmunk genotype I]